jgi:beta-aspartyl-peptidase (threonine type)
MKQITIAIHGGAGPDSRLIRENQDGIKQGLASSLQKGYDILEKGGSSVEAVEAAVAEMENNPLFNAGRGAALNRHGETELEASIMNGHTLGCGAVALVKKVKNPVKLARVVMEHTNHILIAGPAAYEFAVDQNVELETDEYFITEERWKEFMEQKDKASAADLLRQPHHGTIGAVAMDKNGHLAAATSTGGTGNHLPGRIADVAMIGCGCYANDLTCAVSGTGDGEQLVHTVLAHSIAAVIRHTKCTIQNACDIMVPLKRKDMTADVGVIAVGPAGDIGCTFNCERMPRASMGTNIPMQVKIYR